MWKRIKEFWRDRINTDVVAAIIGLIVIFGFVLGIALGALHLQGLATAETLALIRMPSGDILEVEVKSSISHSDGSVTITAEDGTRYMTGLENVLLIKKETDK